MTTDNIAIVRQSDGRVLTILAPGGAANPPDGFVAVPESSLPAGWRRCDDIEPVPDEIEARLLRRWLILHGHSIESIDAAIDAISDSVQRELTRNEWEFATSYARRHPMFGAFVAATGLDDAAIDQAFREAAGYE